MVPTRGNLRSRSASLDMAMCGKLDCQPSDRPGSVDPGLYSVTFSNDAAIDQLVLDAYREFREEAAAKGFRHFLEFVDPNARLAPIANVVESTINLIVRTPADVVGAARPLSVKVSYHGPAALAELAGYDSGLVVGIMCGSTGTACDAFHQVSAVAPTLSASRELPRI